MPYINADDRGHLDFGSYTPRSAGELNYMFTALCIRYLKDRGESYQTYNDMIGALEGCKLELYRRKVAAYEDDKLKSNGDVY